ncbi:15286_t:CDS:2 [Cetraspora pellucida]|uniref:15286_t:CDS:1 n=1 Tax=Cetraspora pellucida TaxID=1433469 RepID=A0A9N9HAG1_9GLOM|nr:15286_t:CDS:2 [Cetraspora pellucida]
MIFPFVSVIRDGKTILSAVLFEVDENLTFEDLLYQADSDYVSEEVVRVDIQVRAKKCLPNSKPSTNCNDQLYNDILELLRSKNLGWEYGMQNSLGITFINKLVSLLYYLDDKHKMLKLHSLKIPSIFFQLPLYQQNSYYKNGKHHKTILRRKELELQLCTVAHTYANYLEIVNLHVQRIQSSSVLARSPEKDIGDSSAIDNSHSAEINQRLKIMLELEDPEI